MVNSVDYEIKLNVGAAQIGKAMQVFGLSPTGGAERRIWFGEIRTGRDGRDALPLLARGVIVRVRAKANSGDVTIKLRGPDGCLDVKAWSKHAESFTGKAKIEGDWADRRLVSASLESKFGEAGRAELDTDEPSVAKLLSSEQQQLAWELFVPFEQVQLLGPITARKWEPDGGIAAELWAVDELRFLEISVVADDDPETAQRALEERARNGGLTLDRGQEPKTTRVLRHLARRAG